MKISILLITLTFVGLLSFQSIAQKTACQSFNLSITAATPSFFLNNGIYEIHACPGDSIYIATSGIYPNNNISYHQSDSLVSFNWNNITGTSYPTNNSILISNATSQTLNFTLTALDNNNCASDDTIKLRIIVSPTPSFVGTSQATNTICQGDSTSLSAIVTPGGFSDPIFNNLDTTYLPDGSGISYTSVLNISGSTYPTLMSTNLIEFWAIIEHSYLGDLNIMVSCPNGQSAVLKSYPGGGGSTFLGEPIDNNSAPVHGVGYEYHWSNMGTTTMINAAGNYNYTFVDVLGNTSTNNYLPPSTNYPSNSTATGTLATVLYTPEANLNNLIGCPINGNWTLTITDNLSIDNGFIFGWGIDLYSALFPSTLQNIVSQSWNSSSSIITNNADSITVLPNDSGIFQYTYTAIDSLGCIFDTSLYVESLALPLVNLGNDTILCANQSINLSSGSDAAAQFWSTNSSLPVISIDSAGIGLNSKEISVQVIGINGCTNKDTIIISFATCNSISNIHNDAKLMLYPNPSDGIFTISGSLNNDKNIQMQIYNSSARLIIQKNLVSINGEISRIIDMRNYAKGIYYIRLSNTELEKTIKIIIK